MRTTLLALVTVIILASCAKNNETIDQPLITKNVKPLLRTGGPDEVYFDHPTEGPCIYGPDWCYADIAVTSPGAATMISEFINAVKDETYADWLSVNTNYDFIVSLVPECKDYFDMCISGEKAIMCYKSQYHDHQYAILIGNPSTVSYENNDVAIVLEN